MNPYLRTLIGLALIGWPCCFIFMMIVRFASAAEYGCHGTDRAMMLEALWASLMAWLLLLTIAEGFTFLAS